MVEERLSKHKLSERNQKRREMLAVFLYYVAKLTLSGVGIGGLSPLLTGDEMNAYNYIFILLGVAVTCGLAFTANNSILKPDVKLNNN